MKCFKLAAVALVFGLGLPQVVVADELKIAVVDLQRALTTTKQGKSAQEKLEEDVKKAQGSIEGKKKEIEKAQEAYNKQKESLNQKARADKEEQLITMEKEIKRLLQDSQEGLRRKNNQLVGELVKKLRVIIEDIGKEDSYSMVLERSSQAVIYADKSIDITDEVIKRFDDKN
jgi:outer membrane protein